MWYQLFVSVGSFETARGAAVAGPARGAAWRMQMYATDSQSGCQNGSSHSASFLPPLSHIANQEAVGLYGEGAGTIRDITTINKASK